MKRFLLLVLLAILLSGFLTAQIQKTDVVHTDNYGKVKSVRETIYSRSNKPGYSGSDSITSDKFITFYPDGKKQKISIYKLGTLFSYTVYNYNEQNVKISCKEYNADNSLYLTITFTSNEDGLITKADYDRLSQKSYDDERYSIDVEYDKYYQNLFTNIIFKNDYKGNILEEKYITQNGALSFKILNNYDYKYNRVGIKYYNNSGNVSWRKKLKYDSKGNVIESKLFESNRLALVSKFEYEFDNNNNWIKRIETRILYDNFFADNLNNNTLTTIRKIEYY